MENKGNVSEDIKNFIVRHWFQIGLLAVAIFVAWTAYQVLVLLPERNRREEAAMKMAAEMAAETKEEERRDNLEQCLEESEYQEQTAHLALCGDPNVGRAPSSCSSVFGGAKNIRDVIRAYNAEFPNELPELESLDNLEENLNQRLEIVNGFFDKCNCGLEKYRRDELNKEKESRDNLCIVKYEK